MPVEIVSYRPFEKSTLRGFATIALTSVGLEIKDCSIHSKHERRWVNLPSRPYKNDSGKQAWSPIVRFTEKETYWKFSEAVVEALDSYLAKNPAKEINYKNPESSKEEVPF